MKTLLQYANERRGLDKIINTYQVPSKSEKGKFWTVAIDIFGNIYCDCPNPRNNCSHIKIIKYKYGRNNKIWKDL